jgi:site-specific DNA-methyltransferase (cytosine-N4-specific)
MMEINKIYNADAITAMKNLEDESVDCVLTSPPYFQLRRYGNDEREIGRESSVEGFIENLRMVFVEARRVLKKDGTLWIVIGDTYNGTAKKKGLQSKESYNDYSFRENVKSVKNKSLIGIPERLMVALIDDGWICRNNIIWHKPNAMPSSTEDRFTVDYENILFFTKSSHYYFNQMKEQGWDSTRNKRSVWSIKTQPSDIEHYAMFPTELVDTILECGARPEGVVLDMFAGAGTTLKIAKMRGYRYIGVELYAENCSIIERRLESTPVVYSMDLETDA